MSGHVITRECKSEPVSLCDKSSPVTLSMRHGLICTVDRRMAGGGRGHGCWLGAMEVMIGRLMSVDGSAGAVSSGAGGGRWRGGW